MFETIITAANPRRRRNAATRHATAAVCHELEARLLLAANIATYPYAGFTINEGDSINFTTAAGLTPDNPTDPTNPGTITVDYGDGTTPDVANVTADNPAASLSHTFADDGVYTVTAVAADWEGPAPPPAGSPSPPPTSHPTCAWAATTSPSAT